MAVEIYKSTDGSAPVLTGQVGSLVALLDACLVTGYGAKAAAGWTKPYTGTNSAQFRMGGGGTGCDLYVNDNGPGAGAAKEARINGFKVGSAIGAGTGQFPTLSQSSIGIGQLVVRKSNTADATARPWTIVANQHVVYCFIETGDQTSPLCSYPWMFGDFFSYAAGDTNNSMIIARRVENISLMGSATISNASSWISPGATVAESFCGIPLLSAAQTPLSDTIVGHFVCGNFTGVGGSLAVGKHTHQYAQLGGVSSTNQFMSMLGYLGSSSNSSAVVWPGAFNYPNPADGGLFVAPIFIHHGGGVRGYMKGLWAPMQHVPLGHGDTYNGTNNLTGKSFIAMNILGSRDTGFSAATSMTPAQVHVETSDTWN